MTVFNLLLHILGITAVGFASGFPFIFWLTGDRPISLPKRIVAAIIGLPLICAGIYLLVNPIIGLKGALIVLIAGAGLVVLITFG